ncbi:VOC family protein [Aureimonas jatrophae]|uniref:Glyoxalase/Bleomycin resistance protein/Dioxygenase superfamily protein n=1 Tax=Aureimonas jatrophae TaxID=1166073 RepID=A0A1H0DA15_9HYPH|nr:VOC family protein [Aureimonas jatrophae]MBB3951782.1 catechol 2,3-dioxygenase-like lactoylglutathione lyase family enzyme [Aureimonas jatrophae]SDN67054.1 Glyoxalase/Bleomycin resistance protein/Dioxygenase superfamily protein [Aureimonas jatrophae]
MSDTLRIAAIVREARDPAALGAFYRAAFDAVADGAGAARLGCERVEFVPGDGPPASAPSNSVGFQHLAIIVSDMAAAMDRLRAVPGWSAISLDGPEQLPEASGGVAAFKFRDPEGHPLEFLRFPDGRAPDPWRDRAGLFLGIDHSAISVRDTDESLRFYERLGFTVLSRQTNRGAEQARMDGLSDVDPARVAVEVTGLQPPGGAPPHLELLCYRTPASIAAVPGLRTALRLSGAGALPAHDPDGHALLAH